jgi:hypothetical protein
MKFFGIGVAEDWNRDRVVKYQRRRVVELMRRSTQSDAKSSSGGAGFFHNSVDRGVARIKRIRIIEPNLEIERSGKIAAVCFYPHQSAVIL